MSTPASSTPGDAENPERFRFSLADLMWCTAVIPPAFILLMMQTGGKLFLERGGHYAFKQIEWTPFIYMSFGYVTFFACLAIKITQMKTLRSFWALGLYYAGASAFALIFPSLAWSSQSAYQYSQSKKASPVDMVRAQFDNAQSDYLAATNSYAGSIEVLEKFQQHKMDRNWGYVARMIPLNPSVKLGALAEPALVSDQSYALVIYPTQYDVTGYLTFAGLPDGKKCNKDWGPDTVKLMESATEFDPKSWKE